MKHLCYCLIVSFLFLAESLSAQQFRLRTDLGTSGVFNNAQMAAPVASLGLEALISLSPRTFLVPEVGLQQTHISHARVRAPDLFIAGFSSIVFNSFEIYEMKQTSAFMGLGVEQHLHRVRLQLFGRVMKRFADRITFEETTNFQRNGRPDNEFSTTVKPGEIFLQDMQSGTLRYSDTFTFQSGFSLRYDLTGGFELGLTYAHGVGNLQLERRVISFCDSCPVSPDAEPERKVSALTNTASISGRWAF